MLCPSSTEVSVGANLVDQCDRLGAVHSIIDGEIHFRFAIGSSKAAWLRSSTPFAAVQGAPLHTALGTFCAIRSVHLLKEAHGADTSAEGM